MSNIATAPRRVLRPTIPVAGQPQGYRVIVDDQTIGTVAPHGTGAYAPWRANYYRKSTGLYTHTADFCDPKTAARCLFNLWERGEVAV